MRVERLDLLRYGHFTDLSINLPHREMDFHVIFGPNEAGKSTAMAAIEDLLFGIPSTSPRNFLHDYTAMRIGGILDSDGNALEVRRRKGNKDTLLGANDLPLPAGDGALAGLLGGANREFFVRMFALDHERLREGGRDIVAARDDVGQMLFAAGAGIAGLRGHLTAMAEEADSLWGTRRSGRRKYAQAEERLKAADAALREHTVTTNKWQDLKTAFESSNDACVTLEREIEENSAELRKLTRIRRVCRDVHKRAETEATITALGTVIVLPEDATASLETAARNDEAATTRMTTLTEQIEALQKERDTLTYDEGLLQREQDIALFHDRRIQIRAGKADLPKRRAELAGAEAAISRLASDLDWQGKDIDQIVACIPARAKIAAVRGLLSRHGGLVAAVENATAAMQEAVGEISDLDSQISASGEAIDTATLSAAIKVARNAGDFAARTANAKREFDDAEAAIQRRVKGMNPAPPDEEVLAVIAAPPIDSVQTHRDAYRDLDHRIHAVRERLRMARQDLVREQSAYRRMVAEEKVVSPNELARAREHREKGWMIIKRRHFEGAFISENEVRGFTQDEDLPRAYEAAVHHVDLVADRRFEKAENAAQLVVISRKIEEQQDTLDALLAEEEALVAEQTALTTVWTSMWAPSGVSPLDPDAMLEFLAARRDVLEWIGKRDAARRQIDIYQGDEAAAKVEICTQLGALGVDVVSLKDAPLKIVLVQADELQKQQERVALTKHDLQEARRKALGDVERKRKTLEKAESQWIEWTAHWNAALATVGLAADSAGEAIQTQINAIDEMRELAVRINDLRHERIEKIERDISAFDADVSALVTASAPRLSGVDSENAVLELERLLRESVRVRDAIAEKDIALSGLHQKIDTCEASRREAREIIEQFQRLARVDSLESLRAEIKRSDELRLLQSEYQGVTAALSKDGDGFSVEQLHDECAQSDPDQVAAREQAVDRELNDLRDRHIQARENRNAARRNFESIGGDDRAARAAADRQSALAVMNEAAAQYIRLRSAGVLLQWAIDRFRREKQAPLLKRAGELFSILTDGSFETLTLEFDHDDTPHLAGIRRNGDKVRLPGLSTGAGDQLYLSLRIAAVEEYLEHAAPLPFIADDLFINYDDGRAAAGLRVLGHLAGKTQVLFFTHHQHLIEVARRALGDSVSTVSLKPALRSDADAAHAA
jgi:uncharacterized protein YhaN